MNKPSEIKSNSGFKAVWPLILVLIGLIIFTIVLGTVYSRIQSKKIRTNEQNMLSAVVDLKVKQIVNWRQERKSDALIILNNSSAASFINNYFQNKVKKTEVNRWIESFCTSNGYSSATIFDTNNKIRFSYGFKGDSISRLGYDLLAEVYKKHNYILSDLHFSEAAKKVTINLLIPLINWEQTNHPIIGVILLRIDPYKILYPLIQSWPAPSKSSETVLLKREENNVVFLNELRFQKGTALKFKFPLTMENLPAAKAAMGYEGVFEGKDYRGVDVLAVTRTIPDSPWFIVGKVDRIEIYEPLYQQIREYEIIISLLILLITITLGLWWWNQRAAFYREKYHSERALHDSEIKYRNLYNNTPVMLHSIDTEGKLLSVSDYWLKAMGYERNEVIGRKSTDFLTEKSMRFAKEKVIPDFMQTGFCNNIEYQFVKKNGEIIETLLSAVSERDNSGQVVRSLAVITDISHRKQVEKEISLLAHAMKSIKECISITDMHDNIMFVNQSFLETYGYKQEELIGQNMSTVRSKSNLPEIIKAILPSTLQGGWEGEILNRKKDGSDFPISLSTSIVYDQFGHPISLIGVATDITERRKAEKALLESEEWFRTLFEQSGDGIFFLNLNGEIITVNDSFASMHGYSVDEIRKMNLSDFDTPESTALFPERIGRILAGENLIFEVEHFHKDGHTFPLEVTASLITVSDEKYVLASHRNITDRKRAQEALRQSETYLRGILDSTDDGILAVDNFGKIINTNNRFAELWNIPKKMIDQKDDKVLIEYVLDQLSDPGAFLLKVQDLYNSDRTDFGILQFKDSRIFERYSTPLVLDKNIVGRVWSFRDVTEHMHAEQILQKAKTLYQDLVETSQDLIWQCDLDGRFEYLNPAWEDIFVFKIDEMLGKKITDFQTPEYAERYKKDFARLLKGNTIKGLDTVLVGKAGNEINLIFNAKYVKDENGKISGTKGTAYDISEHKRAEALLRENADLFRNMTNNTPLGMHFYELKNNDLIFVNANPAADTLLKTTNSQYIGQTIEEAFPALAETEVPQRYRDAAQKGILWATEQISYQDEKISGAFEVKAFQTTPGKMVAVFMDITERKQAEELLRNSEKRFSAIFHNSPIGMSLTKFPDGRIKDVNQAYLNLTGYTREQVVGKLTTDIKVWVDLDLRAGLIKQVSEKGTARNVINHFRKKTGEIVDVEMSFEMIDLEGKPFALTVIQDISKRKKAEEAIHTLNTELEQRVRERTSRLEASNKELEAFSYSVSHDLRTPLRAIDGFSEILLENYSAVIDEQGKDYLNRVRAATQRMAQLIDNLLNLSRISRTEMTFKQVNLSTIATSIKQELQNATSDRKVNFVIQPKVIARGDAALLRYVLDNLLGNAWKFTTKNENAKIEFGTTEINGKQAFYVKDDGAGFDMAYYDKLFGAFQRLHSATEFPGTGVGLATVQRIVHLHGGQVWAEGATGKGSTFYFTLS